MRLRWLLLGIVVLMIACHSANETKNKIDAAVNAQTTSVLPSVGQIDSVQVIYYDDPDGDSLRYTRYFTYATSNDTALFSDLTNELQKTTDTLNDPRKCRSEGKMYVFAGKPDEPVKTIYFSTRCDTCCYLYFIKNGLFYYSGISEKAANKIKELKKQAVQP